MIANILPLHYRRILTENQNFVHWLAPLDHFGLTELHGLSEYARQIENGKACLFAYPNDINYHHANIDWLRKRLDRFYYIDRVIIAKDVQGRGLGRMLYDDLIQHAISHGYRALACEVNTVPNNPGSHQFHEALGFMPIGERSLGNDSKSVRYYVRDISSA